MAWGCVGQVASWIRMALGCPRWLHASGQVFACSRLRRSVTILPPPLLPEFVFYKWWDTWPSHQPISLVAMQEQNAVWNGLKQSLVSPIFSPGCMHVWRGTLACIDFISFYFELIKRAFLTGINAIVLISIIDMAGVFVCSRCFLDLNGVLRKLKFRQDTEANT